VQRHERGQHQHCQAAANAKRRGDRIGSNSGEYPRSSAMIARRERSAAEPRTRCCRTGILVRAAGGIRVDGPSAQFRAKWPRRHPPKLRVRSSTRASLSVRAWSAADRNGWGYMHAVPTHIGLHYSLACPATPRPGPGAAACGLPVRLRVSTTSLPLAHAGDPGFCATATGGPARRTKLMHQHRVSHPAFPTFRMPSAPTHCFITERSGGTGVAFVVGKQR